MGHVGRAPGAPAEREAKLAKAKALGADHGINHASRDIAAEVRTLTGKRGVDVVSRKNRADPDRKPR